MAPLAHFDLAAPSGAILTRDDFHRISRLQAQVRPDAKLAPYTLAITCERHRLRCAEAPSMPDGPGERGVEANAKRPIRTERSPRGEH
jgi:hypothetical protein